MALDRRSFLVSLGAGGYQAVLASNSALAAPRAADIPVRRRVAKPPEFFTPIAPSSADRLILPKGFTADLVIRWNDPIDAAGDERFGFNNDFLAYFPLDALQGGSNCFEGLLWVNHEYPDPLFLSGYSKDDYQKRKRKTVAQIEAERAAVGGCILHVKQERSAWKPVIGSRFNCRFSAKGPMIGFSGPAAALRSEARGTLANCSGGRTPWFTALSCEENYPDYNASDPAPGEGYRWGDAPGMALDERDYGWIVEIDPFGELPPIKHTALGRFKHENAAVTLAKDGRLVVYMGDDEADQHLYKYVSAEPLPKDA
ncbi:MAG TPA: alkaline phosphatase PhoX, partial [Planctomycetia bacterium]|nr:alkaline phosphatase PhoX [Planctomycetia bacterium]